MRVKRIRPARYWEHASVCVDIHEARALQVLLQRAELTDAFNGACQRSKEKLATAVARMAPRPDVCAGCRHHKTHHGRKGRTWMKAPQVCSGNWPEQGPCKCKKFRGQK